MKNAGDVTEELLKAAVIYGIELPRERLAAYLEALLPSLDADTLCAAIRESVKTCKFFPNPAEILGIAKGDTTAAGEAAWRKATSLARADGWTLRLEYEKDPALARAIGDAGGISAIRDRLTKDEPFMKRRFLAVYASDPTVPLLRLDTGDDEPLRLQ